tara:strand:+ start:112 stop:897 length:786 start_codon:yes stop_codon:yes gene_type:complete
MTKKKEKTTEKVVTPIVEEKVDSWEIKDRIYKLKGSSTPLTYTLPISGSVYFDEEKGYEREVGYASNQPSPFVDEWKGVYKREHIVFTNGSLWVPKNKTILQKYLSKYCSKLNKLYTEVDNKKKAIDEHRWLEFELQAMNLANSLDIDEAEAIMRVEKGSAVSQMSSKEIKRDLLVMARNNPNLFIELAQDDNIGLRNIAIKAVEQKIIDLSPDKRSFNWSSNGRKLMTIPFDEHPYSALAAWFKTDEGMEVLKQVEKRLS